MSLSGPGAVRADCRQDELVLSKDQVRYAPMNTYKWKFIGIAAVVATAHLALVAYILSETTYSRDLQLVYDVLSFSLVYLDRFNYRGSVPAILSFDRVPVLVVSNSLLWGAVLATLWFWWRRWRRSQDPGTNASGT